MLKMDLEYKKKILFVRLSGNLNRRVTYKIYNYLVPVLEKHKIPNVIYNLENLKSIDESGVDAILSTKCKIRKQKGNIFLCEVSDEVLSKLKRVHIKSFKTESEVLKRLEVY